MEDLLQRQIYSHCKLSLPEGLKELMSDISREVLRAQPAYLYQFIADYLSALLVARENLTIAARLCKDVCSGDCYPELVDELRYIGLDEEDAEAAKTIILDYFEGGGANESNLMLKIAKKISLEKEKLSAIQDAVRKAFQRNLINNTTFYESSSDSDLDDVSRAAKHTIQIYRKTKHNPDEYRKITTNVQTTYRAYGVERPKCPDQETLPQPEKITEKTLRFSADVTSPGKSPSGAMKPFLPTVSSTSLAGSYLNLPKYVPYTVHHSKEGLDNLDEVPEKENVTIDYTDIDSTTCKKINFQYDPRGTKKTSIPVEKTNKFAYPTTRSNIKSVEEAAYPTDKKISIQDNDTDDDDCSKDRKISFHDVPLEIEDQAVLADNESEISVDEDLFGELDTEDNLDEDREST